MGLTGDLTMAEAKGLGEELLTEIVATTQLSRQLVRRRLDSAPRNAWIRKIFVDEWPDLAGELANQTVASAKANDLVGMIAKVTKLDYRTVQFVLDQVSGRTHVPNAFEFAWPGKVDSEKREELIREFLSNQNVATIRRYDLFAELASTLGLEEQFLRNTLSAHRGHKLFKNIRAEAAVVPTGPDLAEEAESDDEDERKVLSLIPEDGTSIGNGSLRDRLGWEEGKYLPVRARLLEKGLIWLGKGRGGSVMLASGWRESRRRELLALVPDDGTAISNLTLIRQLEWEESFYGEIKMQLVEEGLLQIGKGRGGSVFRPSFPSPPKRPVMASTAEPSTMTTLTSAKLAASHRIEIPSKTEPQNGVVDAVRSYPAFTGRVVAPPVAAPAAFVVPPAAPGGLSFPPPLLEAYRQNKLAVLFGSGLSPTKNAGGPFPTWRELPERLLDQALQQGVMSQRKADAHREVFASGHVSLNAMLTGLEGIKSELADARKYQIALDAIFCPENATSGDAHHALVDLGVNVLVTTNYDQLLEFAEGPPRRSVYTWQEADSALSRIKGGHKVLFKIHGTADREKTVVMTRREYDKAAGNDGYKEIMRHLLQSYTFLLVGYGINDPCDLDMAFSFSLSAFGSAANAHYALMKDDATHTDVDRWQRELNVKVVPYEDHAHLPAILRALRAHKS